MNESQIKIQTGQVYRDKRNEQLLQLVYKDNDHILLKNKGDGHALLQPWNDFKRNVEASRFELHGQTQQKQVDSQESVSETPINFTTISGIGQVGADSIRSAGYTTAEDIDRASNDELLACRGIGDGNLSNLREYVSEKLQ